MKEIGPFYTRYQSLMEKDEDPSLKLLHEAMLLLEVMVPFNQDFMVSTMVLAKSYWH